MVEATARMPANFVRSPLMQRPLEVIGAQGAIQVGETAGNTQVLLLPTRTVSEGVLDSAQWGRRTGMGNQRTVYSVDDLQTGGNPGIVVKEAERLFTTRRTDLEKGVFWWQGKKSGVRPVRIEGSAVEVQTVWEAAMLTELFAHGINAEVPQALLVAPSGRVSLVVASIDEGYGPHQGPSPTFLLEQARTQTSLIPGDDAGNGYNWLTDRNGVSHLIDINRWRWPNHTDEVDVALVTAIEKSLV